PESTDASIDVRLLRPVWENKRSPEAIECAPPLLGRAGALSWAPAIPSPSS
ncbi:hypothetical protein FGB62_41g00, partial [Gracilaria domingensis]